MLERSSLGGRARPAKKSKPWKRLEFAWLNLPPQLVRQLPQLWELRYEHQFNHRFSIGSWMINDLGRVGRGLYRLRKIHSGRFWEGKGTTSVVPISSFPIGSKMINDLGRVGRLYRLQKNLNSGWFWEGHDFSRADKFLPFDTPSMLQHARNRLSRVFPQLALAVPFQSAKSMGLIPRAR